MPNVSVNLLQPVVETMYSVTVTLPDGTERHTTAPGPVPEVGTVVELDDGSLVRVIGYRSIPRHVDGRALRQVIAVLHPRRTG